MSLAAPDRMLLRTLVTGLLVAFAVAAHAFTLDDVRVQATLLDGSSKDPFRVRARLGDVDAHELVQSFATIRFGGVVGNAPAGAFVRHGNVYTWRSYLYGVKKVAINVKKGTLDVVGGGLELGDLPGPVILAFATAKGVACGTFEWTSAQVTRVAAAGRRGVRKTGGGPLGSCLGDDLDHRAPSVFITSPTPLPGVATTVSSIDVGGVASDDVGVVGLTWSTDQGAGASLVPSPSFAIEGITLAPGDNRVTITATDAAGNVGTDALDVTYNTNGIVFEGMPAATPESLVMQASDALIVRQKILVNPDLDPASIEVMHLGDDGSMDDAGGLADGGDRKEGDDLPGDEVYSGVVGVAGGRSKTVPEHYRVAARTTTQPDVVAMSPIVTIPRVEPVSDRSIAAAIMLADNAKTFFTQLTDDGEDAESAIEQVALLATASGATAGVSDGGLGAWWVTTDGLLGGFLGYDQSTKRGGTPSRTASLPRPHPVANTTSGALPAWPEVGSRRALVLAPFFSDAEPTTVDALLRGQTCPQYDVTTILGADADAEHFKGLEEYGLILIASHGDTLFTDVGDAYRPEWEWQATDGQAVVLTSTLLDATNRRKYERDLRMGRMAIFPEGRLAVLPSYFTQYSVRLPQSVVYAGTCGSAVNRSLSSALLERGAGAVFGYDGYVESTFAATQGLDLFSKLIAGQSFATAFTPADDGATPPATFAFDGDGALVVPTGPIVNRSFEVQSGFLASVAGFTVTGDGRIIGNLGAALPTDGVRMALVSTGLGVTKESGQFSQSVCLPPLPPGATTMTLEYDWKFYSEEFLEYCTSQFQDYFRVSFGDTELQKTAILELCNNAVAVDLQPADVAFDQGDVHMTKWLHSSVDITSLAGSTGTLVFAAGDVGDSYYDTVILVDDVRITVQ
jgi:hypothetical protein